MNKSTILKKYTLVRSRFNPSKERYSHLLPTSLIKETIAQIINYCNLKLKSNNINSDVYLTNSILTYYDSWRLSLILTWANAHSGIENDSATHIILEQRYIIDSKQYFENPFAAFMELVNIVECKMPYSFKLEEHDISILNKRFAANIKPIILRSYIYKITNYKL